MAGAEQEDCSIILSKKKTLVICIANKDKSEKYLK